jgi:CRISPR-associated protein Cmr2
MMDGDRMGEWLRGERSPKLREVYHEKLTAYFKQIPGAESLLDARRPVGPALHAAISDALARFSNHHVPEIVRAHQGALVYAGGDDVMALLPAAGAIACAAALRAAFRGVDSADPCMGDRATLSAGIAFVHYKEDLRASLQYARDAEQMAKQLGKDMLCLAACRRSGEHITLPCPWSFVSAFLGWIDAFLRGASDRWAYHLAAELETLLGLPKEAMCSEVRRQVDRSEADTRSILSPGASDLAGKRIVDDLGDFNASMSGRDQTNASVLQSFVKLAQTASFLARGRDR